MRVSPAGCCLALLLLPAIASSQEGRYELGRRVVEFEREFEGHLDDPAVRKRTVGPLNEAVKAFFSMNVAKTAQALTEARFAIKGEKPTPEQLWAASLQFVPESRFVDNQLPDLKVAVKPFYDAKFAAPMEIALRLQWNGRKETHRLTGEFPGSFRIALNDGFRQPDEGAFSIGIDGEGFPFQNVPLSATPIPKSVLSGLKRDADHLKNSDTRTLEAKTLQHVREILQRLYQGETLETDYPAGRLCREMVEVVRAVQDGKDYYGPSRSGQFWLAIPTENKSAVVRLLVPEKLTAEKKVPLVVALHGLGGSENMFFDACGAGCCVRECQKRGWMMVAPRAGFSAAPVAEIVAELSKRYPVDPKRVFVIGHSMGAGHALQIAQEKPDLFAGLAALGGGGRVGKPEAFARLPVFIGVGDADFARRGSAALGDMLTRDRGAKVVYKEYEDVEHMAIVQVAIRDVFAFFESIKK